MDDGPWGFVPRKKTNEERIPYPSTGLDTPEEHRLDHLDKLDAALDKLDAAFDLTAQGNAPAPRQMEKHHLERGASPPASLQMEEHNLERGERPGRGNCSSETNEVQFRGKGFSVSSVSVSGEEEDDE